MKSLYLCVCERGVAYVSVLNSNYIFFYTYIYMYLLAVSLVFLLFLFFNSMVECDIAVKPNLKK